MICHARKFSRRAADFPKLARERIGTDIDIGCNIFAQSVEDSLAETCVYPSVVHHKDLSAIAQVSPCFSKCSVLAVEAFV